MEQLHRFKRRTNFLRYLAREFSSNNNKFTFRLMRINEEIKRIIRKEKFQIYSFEFIRKLFYQSRLVSIHLFRSWNKIPSNRRFTGYHVTSSVRDRRVSEVEKREARCPPGWNAKSKQRGPVCRENKRNIHGMLAPATCPLARESMQICVLLKCCCSVSRFVTRLPRPFLSLSLSLPPLSLFLLLFPLFALPFIPSHSSCA